MSPRDKLGRPGSVARIDDLEEVRFTLRAPQFVFGQIDAARASRVGFVSRNTWILEAITEKLQRELLGRAP